MKRIALITLQLAVAIGTIAHAQQAVSLPVEPSAPGPVKAEPGYAGANATPSRNTALTPSTWNLLATAAQAVLVVPSQQMPAASLSELTADLDVMCAVLDQALGDAGVKTRSWGPHVNRYRRGTRSLYLPGFGALFLVEVEFPLAPPPTTEQPTDEETTDAVWVQVRNSMRSQPTRSRSAPRRTQAQYDDLKVQSLNRTLRRAMRHCANLRHLGPDEQIVAVAIEAGQARSPVRYLYTGDRYSTYKTLVGTAAAGPAHVLTIQAIKKDIDALADGQLGTADFQQRVKTLSY
ncbi:MAG: hypothetical protein ACYTAS_13560, partial [Planctomycetota bacterium]